MLCGHLYGLEIRLCLKPLTRLLDELLIVSIAFRNQEFLPDHIFISPHISVDIDAIHVDARALLDDKGDIDGQRDRIPVDFLAHPRKGIPQLGRPQCQLLDGLLDVQTVEGLARLRQHLICNHFRVQTRKVGFQCNIAETILWTLFERKRDEEALAVRSEIRDGRNDAHFGISVFEVKLAEQRTVKIQPV